MGKVGSFQAKYLIAAILFAASLSIFFVDVDSIIKAQSLVRNLGEAGKGTTPENVELLSNLLRLMIIQTLLLLGGIVLFVAAKKDEVNNTIQACTTSVRQVLEDSEVTATVQQQFPDFHKELVRLSETITESRRKEKAIIDKAADVICVLDVAGQFVKVSSVCASQWGYDTEELVGNKLVDFVDQESSVELDKALGAQKSVKQISFENKLRKKDGDWIDLSWSAYWSVKEQGLFCVARDVTIRKQKEELLKASEERLRNILQSLPVAVLMFDCRGTIEFANKRMMELTGFERDEIVGRDAAFFLPALKDSTRNSEEVVQEGQLRCKEMPDAVVEYSVTTNSPDQGGMCILAMLDVTKRYEIEQAKRRFTSMISHDLRTPLTSIQLMMTMFKEGALGSLNERGIYFADKGLTAASGLIVLINDLLDLDKMRQGKLSLNAKPERIAKIVESARASVEGIATDKGIDIVLHMEDVFCIADKRRVVQVVINLISNAMKFSAEGSKVEVTTRAENGKVVVAVRDWGRGIPSDKQQLIFETYAQVSSEDGYVGSGLGLPICKAIVEQHGGQIGLDSCEGQGSTFWFSLPQATSLAEP